MTDFSPTPQQADDLATDGLPTDAVDAALTTPSSSGEGVAAAIATIEEAEGLLGDVEAALERIEAGQYRTCEICGAPLDQAALMSTPTLRRCPVHAG